MPRHADPPVDLERRIEKRSGALAVARFITVDEQTHVAREACGPAHYWGPDEDPFNIRRLFAYRRARRVRSGLPPPPPSPADARTSGSLEGCPPISSLDSGDFSGHGRGAGEVSRAGGEVAAGVRVIVSRARFGGPGF